MPSLASSRKTAGTRSAPVGPRRGSLLDLLVGADYVHHRVDQREVRERLGEVAEVPAGARIDLFCVKAERAGVPEQALAQVACTVALADLAQSGDQPERAD